MVNTQSGFRLPLMHHLVQHRLLDLGPGMPGEMPPAQPDLERIAGLQIDGELPQAGAHPAGQPNGNLAQRSAEVPRVKIAMQGLQPVQQRHVAWAGALRPLRSRPGRGVLVYRKRQKLPLRQASQGTGHPRIQEAHDGAQHAVWGECVAAMYPEHLTVQAEHNCAVGVYHDPIDAIQP